MARPERDPEGWRAAAVDPGTLALADPGELECPQARRVPEGWPPSEGVPESRARRCREEEAAALRGARCADKGRGETSVGRPGAPRSSPESGVRCEGHQGRGFRAAPAWFPWTRMAGWGAGPCRKCLPSGCTGCPARLTGRFSLGGGLCRSPPARRPRAPTLQRWGWAQDGSCPSSSLGPSRVSGPFLPGPDPRGVPSPSAGGMEPETGRK